MIKQLLMIGSFVSIALVSGCGGQNDDKSTMDAMKDKAKEVKEQTSEAIEEVSGPDGTMEKIGEKVDESVDSVKQAAEDAGERIEDAMSEDGTMEEAGEEMDEAMEKAKEKMQ